MMNEEDGRCKKRISDHVVHHEAQEIRRWRLNLQKR